MCAHGHQLIFRLVEKMALGEDCWLLPGCFIVDKAFVLSGQYSFIRTFTQSSAESTIMSKPNQKEKVYKLPKEAYYPQEGKVYLVYIYIYIYIYKIL
jgi:hypothetical protein